MIRTLKRISFLCFRKPLLMRLLFIIFLIGFLFFTGVENARPDAKDQTKGVIPGDIAIPLPRGTSPEETAERDTRKREMLEKKAFTERSFVKVPIIVPAATPINETAKAIEEEHYEDEPYEQISPAPVAGTSDALKGETVTRRPDHTFVILGTAQTISKTVENSKKFYAVINDMTSKFRISPSETLMYIDPVLITDEARSALNKLDQVEGVAVSIPGFEYAIGVNADRSAIPEYEVEDNIFTIDAILLEKTVSGEFISRIPASAKDSLDKKTLCLLFQKDAGGNTIASKIQNGCPRTIATVLAKWAKYASLGFDFDKDTDNIMSKGLVMLANSKAKYPETSFETEIRKIIGDDKEALQRISVFMTSHGSSINLALNR